MLPIWGRMECGTNTGKLPTENQRWSWRDKKDEAIGL